MTMRLSAIPVALTLAGLVGSAGLVGCGDTANPAPAATEDPRVVSHLGRLEIQFGDTRAELQHDQGMVQRAGDCAPRLPGNPALSPVFDRDRLVLLWVDPPLRTPSGVMVGTPVDQVLEAYPEIEELPEPSRPFQFRGLLAEVDTPGADDRAYLFLHDQNAVQKVIVGYEQDARRLFHEQFGTC
jgi:hypothetical protein